MLPASDYWLRHGQPERAPEKLLVRATILASETNSPTNDKQLPALAQQPHK
jgi:hypothetical protein